MVDVQSTPQEYVVPFRPVGQPPGALPRTVRLAAKTLPSDRSVERRSVLRAVAAHRAGDFALLTLAPLPNQHALFYHEVSEGREANSKFVQPLRAPP